MRVGRIRRRCRRLVDELGLRPGTGLPGLCRVVERRLGRSVRLVPMSMGASVSGLTAATDEEYWVFYDAGTSPWHQMHIVLHELGHLLLGHELEAAVTEDALRRWTPSVDAATAMRRMGLDPGLARHHCYDDLAERETEVLGTLLMQRLVPVPDRGLPSQGRAGELAATLGPALRHVRGEASTADDTRADDGAADV